MGARSIWVCERLPDDRRGRWLGLLPLGKNLHATMVAPPFTLHQAPLRAWSLGPPCRASAGLFVELDRHEGVVRAGFVVTERRTRPETEPCIQRPGSDELAGGSRFEADLPVALGS